MFSVMSVYYSVHRGSHVTIINDALDLTVQGLLAMAQIPMTSDTDTPDPQPWPCMVQIQDLVKGGPRL